MKIVNPTDSRIAVTIEGDDYVLEAKGGLTGIPEPHAKYWKERLHSFLVIMEEDYPEEVVEEDKEDDAEETEEQEEEVQEEVVEEKPKKRGRPKKSK